LFAVDDKVLRYNRRRETRKGGKFEKRFYGPFVDGESLIAYRLKTLNGSPVKTMPNSRDLKPFSGDG